MPTKRKYNLSDAAKAQRSAASLAAARKRGKRGATVSISYVTQSGETKPWPSDPAEVNKLVGWPRTEESVEQIKAREDALKDDILARFPPLPPNSLTSEHQRRNGLIRGYRISLGLVANKGGREKKASQCPRCGTTCDSTRGALTHCAVQDNS